jgi:hypothetical protein
MTIKALERGFPIVEAPVRLGLRPPGSASKIRIVNDGLLILGSMFGLFRDYKPLTFFGALGVIQILAALIPGVAWLRTPRLTLALVTVGLVLSGLILLLAGLVLHTIARRFQELDQKLQTMIAELRRD